jgi:glucose uptake protein GlcU
MSDNNNDSIDPLITKVIESNYNRCIPDVEDITQQIPNIDKNFYNQFKPFDQILIKPLVNISYIIMKQLGYKNPIIGFLAMVICIIGSFFLYKKNENLTWLFIFFCFFISSFDKLYDNKINNRLKYKEMLLVLVKSTTYLLLYMILKLYIPTNINSNHIWLSIFMITIIIVLNHHTEKIFKQNNILLNKILFVKIINFLLLFIIIMIYVCKYYPTNKLDNTICDLFIRK